MIITDATDAAAPCCCLFLLQLAEHALVVVTSRVPVAPPSLIHQQYVGPLADADARSLLQSLFPNHADFSNGGSNTTTAAAAASSSPLDRLVTMCHGVPLCLRVAGDALAAGRLLIEVCGIAAGGGVVGEAMGLGLLWQR